MTGDLRNLGVVGRGSVIHVANDALMDLEHYQVLRESIRKACGHNDFVVVVTNDRADLAMLNEEKMAEYGWRREDV